VGCVRFLDAARFCFVLFPVARRVRGRFYLLHRLWYSCTESAVAASVVSLQVALYACVAVRVCCVGGSTKFKSRDLNLRASSACREERIRFKSSNLSFADGATVGRGGRRGCRPVDAA